MSGHGGSGHRTGIHLDSIVSPPPLSETKQHKARMLVATQSTDVDECREFLLMLGLINS
jgi:hypothetical protein